MRLRASGKGMRITCAEAKQREDDDDDAKSSEFKGTRASARPLGEVDGDMGGGEGSSKVGIVGPGGEGGPVKSGIGDDAGLVRGHEVSEELERGWG
jgi:hypothetical protein